MLMKLNPVSKILLGIVAVLLVSSLTLGYFFVRDMGIPLMGEGEVSCVPVNFKVSELEKSSFKVTWKTTEECVGYVIYGDSIDDTDKLATPSYGFEKRNSHSLLIDGLNPDTTYYLYIISDDEIYGEMGNVIQTSTTGY